MLNEKKGQGAQSRVMLTERIYYSCTYTLAFSRPRPTGKTQYTKAQLLTCLCGCDNFAKACVGCKGVSWTGGSAVCTPFPHVLSTTPQSLLLHGNYHHQSTDTAMQALSGQVHIHPLLTRSFYRRHGYGPRG